MEKVIRIGVLTTLFSLISLFLFAQVGYNPNSASPVSEDNIMYRNSIIRRINLLEKQNKPFFSDKREITRLIIQAIKEKKVQPYQPTEDPRSTGFEDEYAMDFEKTYKELTEYYDDKTDTVMIRPNELFLVDLKEELVFDRQRSRMYWDTQAITLVMPQGTNPDTELGEKSMVTLKYKDLMQYLTQKHQESQEIGTLEAVEAMWYNPENQKQHCSLAEAFKLRLFSSRILKVANPDNKYIIDAMIDEYGADSSGTPKRILYESQRLEYSLMEFEHNLWEY